MGPDPEEPPDLAGGEWDDEQYFSHMNLCRMNTEFIWVFIIAHEEFLRAESELTNT